MFDLLNKILIKLCGVVDDAPAENNKFYIWLDQYARKQFDKHNQNIYSKTQEKYLRKNCYLYTPDDIDIFITTYNRADYIGKSIESVLDQTAGVKSLTVLDNNSTDNTEEVVKAYAQRGVKYVKTEGFLGNIRKARELATREYCMLFHDDDLLHPQYIERALALITKYEDVSLVCSRHTEFFNDNPVSFNPTLYDRHYLFPSEAAFAEHMYFIECMHYATTIYRTKDYLEAEIEYDRFSKFCDWPLMVSVAGKGNSILVDDVNSLFYRRHDGQDTWTYTNMPSIKQIVNWDKMFYDAIKFNNFFSLAKRYFNFKACCFARGKYELFLSPDFRKENPISCLNEEAKNQGINFLEPEKATFLDKLTFRVVFQWLATKYYDKI